MHSPRLASLALMVVRLAPSHLASLPYAAPACLAPGPYVQYTLCSQCLAVSRRSQCSRRPASPPQHVRCARVAEESEARADKASTAVEKGAREVAEGAPRTGEAVESDLRAAAKRVKEGAPKAADTASQVRSVHGALQASIVELAGRAVAVKGGSGLRVAVEQVKQGAPQAGWPCLQR